VGRFRMTNNIEQFRLTIPVVDKNEVYIKVGFYKNGRVVKKREGERRCGMEPA
jgi:hypothetical protein